jgi:hypothetical protein
MLEIVCTFCGHDPDSPACHCYSEDDGPQPAPVWLPCIVCHDNLVCATDRGICESCAEPPYEAVKAWLKKFDSAKPEEKEA